MARLKSTSEEERRARSELKKLGVEENELLRLYDANYKLRTRARASGASDKEIENTSLKWTNVLKGARQSIRQGKTASEYVKSRAAGARQQYRFGTQKTLLKERILDVEESGSWRERALKTLINENPSAELKNAEVQAIEDLIEAGEIDEVTGSEIYRNAKKRYIATGGNSQSAWDRCLSEAAKEEIENYNQVNNYIADNFGWDLEGIEEAEEEAEEDAAEMFEESDSPAARRFLEKRFREALEKYRGLKIKQ